MKKITCNCENVFETELEDIIDLEKNPKIIDQILDGSFLKIMCPECKTWLKLELPVKLLNFPVGWEIELIPELERNSFLAKYRADLKKEKERVVIGYRELIEKIKIFKDNLVDQAIECLKYHLLLKCLEKTENKDNEQEFKLYYIELKNNELIFHIEGLKKDEIAIFKMPYNLYQKSLNDLPSILNTEPFNNFLIPPYISVNILDLRSD